MMYTCFCGYFTFFYTIQHWKTSDSIDCCIWEFFLSVFFGVINSKNNLRDEKVYDEFFFLNKNNSEVAVAVKLSLEKFMLNQTKFSDAKSIIFEYSSIIQYFYTKFLSVKHFESEATLNELLSL